MGETKSSGILINTIPLSMEHVFSQELMNLVVVEDGYMQVFNFDLSGVARVLNLNNDIGASHKTSSILEGYLPRI
jgi:hypothetical protein